MNLVGKSISFNSFVSTRAAGMSSLHKKKKGRKQRLQIGLCFQGNKLDMLELC